MARESINNNIEIPKLIPEIMAEVYRLVVKRYGEYLYSNNPNLVYKEDGKCQQISEIIYELLKKRV